MGPTPWAPPMSQIREERVSPRLGGGCGCSVPQAAPTYPMSAGAFRETLSNLDKISFPGGSGVSRELGQKFKHSDSA